MLYTLSRSPYNVDFISLLNIVNLGDDLILLSDGVIAGIDNSSALSMLLNYSKLKIYALKNDIIARGLDIYYSNLIEKISYTDFVFLTEKNINQMAW